MTNNTMDEIYDYLKKAKGIASDSRKVKKGYIFVAYKGVYVDGHDFIEQAKNNGAILIVGEIESRTTIPYIKVNNARLCLAKLWARWYGNPEEELKLIGVTGTDGKTTTSTLIYEILKMAGYKVGLISTVSARIGSVEIDTGFHTTTPDPDLFFSLLKKMAEIGCEYAVIETTSHSLAQYRDAEVHYEIGVFTNIANEHLDLHGSIEAYIEAKGRLFQRSEVSILNKKSDQLDFFTSVSKGKVITYDHTNEIRRGIYKVERERMLQGFEMIYENKWLNITTELPGKYNQENILAAAKVAEVLKIDSKKLVEGIASVKKVRGRFELVKNLLGLHIVVDFAHTDQAIHNVLSVVKNDFKGDGKLITIFGCIGERGRSKRKMMGKEACLLSDLVIVTADDPRKDSMDDIFLDIEIGCRSVGGVVNETYFRIDDREEAIRFAITKLASPGDWVMVLGKGHEQSINIGGRELPWDDVKIIKRVLKNYGRKS